MAQAKVARPFDAAVYADILENLFASGEPPQSSFVLMHRF
jgi:hypothetical protein